MKYTANKIDCIKSSSTEENDPRRFKKREKELRVTILTKDTEYRDFFIISDCIFVHRHSRGKENQTRFLSDVFIDSESVKISISDLTLEELFDSSDAFLEELNNIMQSQKHLL